jgi:lysozyme
MAVINAAGLELVKEFEGLSLVAYADAGGVLTIGYGHTDPGVFSGQRITEEEADALLNDDLADAEADVSQLVEIALTPNQFSALVSWQFNTGALRSSTGLDCINSRRFEAAWDDHFCLWVQAGGEVQPGLVRRRAAERALFFTP